MEDEATFVPPSPPRKRERRKPPTGAWNVSDDEEGGRFGDLMGRVMVQIGTMISARFEAIKGRLLP